MDYKTPKSCLEANGIIEEEEYYKGAVRIMGDLKKIDPMILNDFLYSPAVSSDDLILARKRVEKTLMDEEWCKLFGISYGNLEDDVILPLTILSLFENARMKQRPGTIEYCISENKELQLQDICSVMKRVIPSLAKIDSKILQETINLAEGNVIKEAYHRALDICYSKDSGSFGIDSKNPEKFEKATQLYFLFALKREKLLSRFNNLEIHVVK